jgi:hypothetical protein
MSNNPVVVHGCGYRLVLDGGVGSVEVLQPGATSMALVAPITPPVASLMGLSQDAHLVTWLKIQGEVLGGPQGTIRAYRPSMFVTGTEVDSLWVSARMSLDVKPVQTADAMARGLTHLLGLLKTTGA